MTEPVLSLTDVRFSWQPGAVERRPLFHIPELTLAAGSTLFISGPSGCGKSTLLNIITGLLPPSGGAVNILGQSLYAMKSGARDRFRAAHLGVIAQTLNLLPYLTVQENLSLMQRFAGQTPDKHWQQALLAELNLADQYQQTVSTLSLGQQQRAAIARALVNKPALIIADEPTSALDDDNKDAFMQLLLRELRQLNAALLMVSHDRRLSGECQREVDLRQFQTEVI
ncbi:ABC transporter ATP-binding protein [Thalassolituus sp. LLYu03]|uniref:ABC transporter ATP-binding protein n=1 Tax=Thalassolituus sp. LLYu03 TaxID=3421656 RepID=UPI003D2CC1C2